MEFNLLLTNRRRVRWLLAGILVYVAGGLGLLGLHVRPSFGAVMALPLALLGVQIFWNKLLRQPAWAQLTAEGLAWENPAAGSTQQVLFAELTAYRFAYSRNGIALRLCLRGGELMRFEGSFNNDFVALHKEFDQAVRHYNKAHPAAPIGREREGLEKFFTRPLATNVLAGLLAAGAAWVAWCCGRGAAAVAYLPLALLLPYLAIWANYYNERT